MSKTGSDVGNEDGNAYGDGGNEHDSGNIGNGSGSVDGTDNDNGNDNGTGIFCATCTEMQKQLNLTKPNLKLSKLSR